MASFNKVNDFVKNAVHNMDLESDQFVVALSNTAPASESQVSYSNLSSRSITTTSSAQASGTYKLVLSDITLTSTGGSTGPFRYIYIYDDTVTAPADPIVGYYDYGSSLTLNDGDSFTVDFNATNGVIQLT